MDESANKGLESKGSDAEIRESRISRIAVEGYDTSLPRADVDGALREHLASCGNIIHVYVPIQYIIGTVCRYSLVYVNEEDEEKVLRLNGSDMGGGRILQISPYPFHANHLDDVLAPMEEPKRCRTQHTMMVTGFDTSLPVDVIETELEKYFPTLDSYVSQNVATGLIRSTVEVYVRGQEGVDKSLERSGRSVGGWNFIVTHVVPLPKYETITGYIHPLCLIHDETETADGNQQQKKKKSKTMERKQKLKKKKRERKQKQRKRERNQKMKGVEISF